MTLNVTAIDPSMTSTGMANLRVESGHVEWKTTLIKSKPNGDGKRILNDRFRAIAWKIDMQILEWGVPDLIVMEGPSYASRSAMLHQLSGFWWKVLDTVVDRAAILIVPPTNRMIYATGNGNAGKDVVMLAASRRYEHAPITNNDDADAVILAAMGARMLDQPIDALPKTHLRAMKALAVDGAPVYVPVMSVQ